MKFYTMASVIAVAAAEKHKIDCKDWVKFQHPGKGQWTISRDDHMITHQAYSNHLDGNMYTEFIKKDNFCIRFDALRATNNSYGGSDFQIGFNNNNLIA